MDQPLVPRASFVLACLFVVTALPAQRVHRVNPTFGQNDPDGAINGEPPDTSNWPHPAAPDANPFPRSTATPAEIAYRNNKAQLGKALFWEEQMSSDNTMACGTCHSIAKGGTDARPGPGAAGTGGAFGVIRQQQISLAQVDYGAPPSPLITRQATGVFTPTMIGAYVFNIQFWDGRAGPFLDDLLGGQVPGFTDWAGLEDQAADPPVSSVEMAHQGINWTSTFVQGKLNDSLPLALVDPTTIPPDIMWMVTSGANYRRIFDKIFFNDPDPTIGGNQGVTRTRIAMAIAHYERTLIPDQAPIDLGTMTASQINGFLRMRQDGCFGCHSITGASVGSSTPALTPGNTLVDAFDNPFSDGDKHDIGNGGGLVKTPTLRNMGLLTRFFSTGAITNINALIDFYDQPGRNPPLGFAGTLTLAQRAEVIDFLTVALTDPRVAPQLPPFDRPQLASERPEFVFESNEYGIGCAGVSTVVPEIIANSPPLVLKLNITPTPVVNWFKVGVGNAAPNMAAMVIWSTVQAVGPCIWVGPPITIVNAGNTNAEGIATVHVPFPLNNSTIGVPHFVQWLVNDNGTRSSSDAAKFTPFQF